MKKFQVNGLMGLSSIYVGESLSNVKEYLPDTEPVIITDSNIRDLYQDRFPKGPVITIGTGEKIKTLHTVEFILRELIHLGCDRSSFILGIGGGIVCDIAGFAASVFLRGVRFGFVSTSLLSQVDASVGGKNGVNLDSFKNMVGVFNQPEFVICDMDMLASLPKSEISNGLAEIVKHCLISDPDMLSFMEQNRQRALDLDPDVISRLVADSVDIKSRVVQRDEKEADERKKLNLGHTIGHAIEKIDQKGHGRAVALGMKAAALFSMDRGYISRADVDRIVDLLEGLNLPTDLDHDADQIIRAAARDKKKQGSDLFFVFLEALGKARVEKIAYEEMNRFIRSIFK
ncbi:3-dehydroquinate synthase [Desulfospira joergensenii]|uniref:3-dehydroquinate synthase n=1 Tax=Desulfospira joergensenii TaxID=53329 RepID=UPI0003B734A2|nr:3-dehydroquinate synthase [Desulfospira joergensenii]